MLLMTAIALTIAALVLVNSYSTARKEEGNEKEIEDTAKPSLTISKKRTGVPGRRGGAGTRLQENKRESINAEAKNNDFNM